MVTFDALQSVKANSNRLVETKGARCIATIETNQPNAISKISALPWETIPIQRSKSETGKFMQTSLQSDPGVSGS